MYNVAVKTSGSERRAAKRSFVVSAFTRAEATQQIARCSSVEDLKKWTGHPNQHIVRYASEKIQRLETAVQSKQQRAARIQELRRPVEEAAPPSAA